MIYELPPKGKEGKGRWKPHLVRPMLVMVNARGGRRREGGTARHWCMMLFAPLTSPLHAKIWLNFETNLFNKFECMVLNTLNNSNISILTEFQSIHILWLASFLYFLDFGSECKNHSPQALSRYISSALHFWAVVLCPLLDAALCNKAIDCHSKGLLGRDTTMAQQPRMSY